MTPPARPAPADPFNDLFAETHERLDAAARRMLGNHHDADDVVQEVYLRAWKALPRFRGASQPFTWLYAILINAVSTFRSRRRWVVAIEDVDEPVEPDDLLRPDTYTELQHLRSDMTAAVEALPDALRSVAVRDLDGLPPSVVAAELGITVGAAKVRLHRARRKLREVALA